MTNVLPDCASPIFENISALGGYAMISVHARNSWKKLAGAPPSSLAAGSPKIAAFCVHLDIHDRLIPEEDSWEIPQQAFQLESEPQQRSQSFAFHA